MAADNELQITFFVTAVAVSAKLGLVLKEAKNISLEAMNAKALVARAGENVRTFKPITDYMVELAEDTVRLVEEINGEALTISRSSLTAMRGREAVQHFSRAKEKSRGAMYHNSYIDVVVDAEKRLQKFQQDLNRNINRLNELLEEIETRMLAANVVTSTSRLEAATVSAAYRGNFESIVAKFERAAKNIRATVQTCRKMLKKR